MDFLAERHSAKRLILVLLAAVFAVELLAMLLLGQVSLPSRLDESVLDATLLTLALLPVFYFLIMRPITAQFQRSILAGRREQRESEARFVAFAGASPSMIHLYAAEGQIMYANPATEQLLGYTPEEIVGQAARAFVHPDDQEAVVRHRMAIIAGNILPPLEVRLRKKDGDFLHVEASGFVVKDETGGQAIGAILSDISQRHQALAEREAQQAFAEKLLAERTDHLEKLLNFTQELSSTTDYAELLGKATRLSMELLGLDYSTLMTLAPGKSRLIIRDTIGFDKALIGTFTLSKGRACPVWCWNRRRRPR